MSINKYQPHLLILSEDKANSDIANGFLRNTNLNQRTIQVLPYVSGWRDVVIKFETDQVPKMRHFPNRRIVLLIDFDNSEDRLNHVQSRIPNDLKDRVFILGVQSEPENLKRDTKKTFEQIGQALAKDCVNNTNDLWGHDLLKHNQAELERTIADVKPFLFN